MNFIQQLLSSKKILMFSGNFSMDVVGTRLNMEDRRQCVRGYWQFSFSSWHLSMAQVDLFGLFLQVEDIFDQQGWRPRPSGRTTPFFMTHHQIGFLVARWDEDQMGQVPCLLTDFLGDHQCPSFWEFICYNRRVGGGIYRWSGRHNRDLVYNDTATCSHGLEGWGGWV